MASRLIDAIEHNDLAAARQALAEGAGAGGADANGTTPLMRCALLGRAELVTLLLAHGADPGARDASNRSAADYAAARRHAGIASQLALAGRSRADRPSLGLEDRQLLAGLWRGDLADRILRVASQRQPRKPVTGRQEPNPRRYRGRRKSRCGWRI